MARGARRIAILGGGMASLTAAYELTRPELEGAFEVTLYQQGWRLGGKGASGRNPHRSHRIEEHGLHVWMGFYENAFRLIRDCYRELGRPPGSKLADWRQAFTPHGYIVFDETDEVGRGAAWPLCFPLDPPDGPTPGDGTPLPTVPEYIPRILHLLATLLSRHEPTRPLTLPRPPASGGLPHLEQLLGRMGELVAPKAEETLQGWLGSLLHGAMELALHLPHVLPQELGGIYHHIGSLIDRLAPPVLQLLDGEELRHTRLLFDCAVTHLRGLIRDGLVLPPFDFSRIDHLDYRQWLRLHGAREETIRSAPVTALYDLVFALDHGMAAGTTLRCATRMLLTYKGALFYKMQAGMGDVVFAPLYTVLQRRGVQFKFFHRVDQLQLARDAVEDNLVIESILIGRQAATRDQAPYEPLVLVEELPCWPSEPRWEQLTRGDELRQGRELPFGGYDLESSATAWHDELPPLTLTRGRDFDDVVLGISLAALPRISGPLIEQIPRYRQMIEGIATTATQAMQLWFDTGLRQLGWHDSPAAPCAANEGPIAGCYPESLDTFADMSHLIDREAWPAGAVRGLAYFCGQLREADMPAGFTPATCAEQWDRALTESSLAWVKQHLGRILPTFARDGDLDWDRLYAPPDHVGAARLAAQYFHANVKPSERYVLSVPGSTAARLYADDLLYLQPGCANLFLAGDWVRTGINGGCIEAATMAGMQAARAIAGAYFDIVGDDAPFRIRPRQPPIIDRGGDVVYAEPYKQDETRLFAFLLPADRQRLAALCDRQLNWTGRFRFTPLVGYVALVFADIASTYSTDPRYHGRGTMRERDVSFWVPVHTDAPGLPALSWFQPYIWVDNGIAMAAGREVYGFPKEVGILTLPEAGVPPLEFAVETTVVKRFGRPPQVGAKGPRAELARVVSVSRCTAGSDEPRPLCASAFDALHGLLRISPSGYRPRLVDWFLRELQAAVPLLFLKQVRDIVAGQRACYQALALANSVPTAVRGAAILEGSYDVTVRGFASHPIVRDLGLGGDDELATIRGCTGFSLDFDFLMEPGRELWRSS